MGEFVGERLAVFWRAEVAGAIAPLPNAPDDATDQLANAALSLRSSDVTAVVF